MKHLNTSRGKNAKLLVVIACDINGFHFALDGHRPDFKSSPSVKSVWWTDPKEFSILRPSFRV
jgi:hypothetical protein